MKSHHGKKKSWDIFESHPVISINLQTLPDYETIFEFDFFFFFFEFCKLEWSSNLNLSIIAVYSLKINVNSANDNIYRKSYCFSLFFTSSEDIL